MEKISNAVRRYGLLVVSLGMPLLAGAQTDQPGPAKAPNGISPPSATGINSVQSVLNLVCTVFDWAFYFLIALAVLFAVIAAFRYLTAAGNPEQVKAANNTLLYAAIAVAVALLAKGIPLIIGSFFGATNTPDLIAC